MPDMAKVAYEAWCAWILRDTGEKFPPWEDVSGPDRSAWDAVAQAVMREAEPDA